MKKFMMMSLMAAILILAAAGTLMAWTTHDMPGEISYEGGKAFWEFSSVAYAEKEGQSWLLGVQYGGTDLPNKYLPSTLVRAGLWELPVNEAAFKQKQDKFAWVFLSEIWYKAVTAEGFTANQRTMDLLNEHALWVNLGEAKARDPFHFKESPIGLYTTLDHY